MTRFHACIEHDGDNFAVIINGQSKCPVCERFKEHEDLQGEAAGIQDALDESEREAGDLAKLVEVLEARVAKLKHDLEACQQENREMKAQFSGELMSARKGAE